MSKKLRKKFRVASSGATIDGRNINPEWLKQAAANYDPNEYAARINVDHSRWASYGDVLALEAVETDGRVDLVADIELNQHGEWVNTAGQKLYTSIELHDSVPGMTGMYVTGLAMTDQPASMRTERLTFSALSRSKAAQTYDTELTADEIKAAFAAEPEPGEAAKSWGGAFALLREGLAKKFKSSEKDSALADEVRQTIAEFADLAVQRIDLEAKRADQHEADLAALKKQYADQQAEFQQLKSSLEKHAPNDYQARPTSSGGKGQVLTEF